MAADYRGSAKSNRVRDPGVLRRALNRALRNYLRRFVVSLNRLIPAESAAREKVTTRIARRSLAAGWVRSGLDERKRLSPAEERRDQVARIDHQFRARIEPGALEALVSGGEHQRVELRERFGAQRHRSQAEVPVLARVPRHREVGIAVIDARSCVTQKLDDLVRR